MSLSAAKRVALSADGCVALSIENDGNLRLREITTGRQLQIFEGHTPTDTFKGQTANVIAASLSADGRVALSAGMDKTLQLWDTETGQCLRVFQSPTKYALRHIWLSPDGQFALTPGESGVAVWQFDWDLEPCPLTDWDDGAFPFLRVFLALHTPYADTLPQDRQPTEQEIQHTLMRQGTPTWTEEEFQGLLRQLQYVSYGWLRPEGVRRKLEEMAANWQNPPPLLPGKTVGEGSQAGQDRSQISGKPDLREARAGRPGQGGQNGDTCHHRETVS